MEVSFLQLLRYLCQRVEVELVNNIREYIFRDYKPTFQKWILSFYFSVLKKKKSLFFLGTCYNILLFVEYLNCSLRVCLEKAMASHFRTLAWKIPWTEEPGRLQAMGSLRVRHDWATSLFTFKHWRRKWQTTPVFLPGESQGRRGLVGCCLWGCIELDTTEET